MNVGDTASEGQLMPQDEHGSGSQQSHLRGDNQGEGGTKNLPETAPTIQYDIVSNAIRDHNEPRAAKGYVVVVTFCEASQAGELGTRTHDVPDASQHSDDANVYVDVFQVIGRRELHEGRLPMSCDQRDDPCQ